MSLWVWVDDENLPEVILKEPENEWVFGLGKFKKESPVHLIQILII